MFDCHIVPIAIGISKYWQSNG